MESSSWHSYPSIYALGHKALDELFQDPVIVEEKIDGCVGLETPILKSDLTYVAAGDLKPGDELIGFDDTTTNPRLRRSSVTVAQPMRKKCYLVETESRTTIATFDHPWMVAKSKSYTGSIRDRKRWLRSHELKPGDQIIALPVWNQDNSRNAGYLAGMFDGEGSLVRHRNGRILSVYQCAGVISEMIKTLMVDKGFLIRTDTRRRKEHHKFVDSIILKGGWTEILRFLGSMRPIRLLSKVASIWEGSRTNSIPRERVISVRDVGNKEIMGLSTSTGTYIANGLFSHNSQFSFGKFEDGYRCRSKGAILNLVAPEKMFEKAVEVVQSLPLREGWTYRAEYLLKPKHNALAYERIPDKHLIIFDINPGHEAYLDPAAKEEEAARLGLECVPLIYQGKMDDIHTFRDIIDRMSILGGQKVEGVVVKNYNKFGKDKKVLMGKFVSEAFKEVHNAEWKKENPSSGDIIDQLIMSYRTPARWAKAFQRLREAGKLENSPKDIGLLMKEVWPDIEKECMDEIKDKLYSWAAQHVKRGVTRGLPEWYKDQLLQAQFNK